MRFRTLHYLSLSYSIAMGFIIAYFFLNEFIENGWRVATVTWAVGLFGMCAQLVYTVMSRRVLMSEPYEEIDTLDNEMMYSEEDAPKIIQNSGFTLFCALIGGVVSTAILIMSTLIYSKVFELELTTTERVFTVMLVGVGLLLSVPAVIYNFRSYKLSGVRENG